MGVSKLFALTANRAPGLVLILLALGCQTKPVVSNRLLIQHQALVDFTGLGPAHREGAVQVICALPHDWEPLGLQRTPLYTHEQWRSPSVHTGVGVGYVHLPLPLSAPSLLWLVRLEYGKLSMQGKMLDEWTDALGREWFEAENQKYHVRGYVVTSGFQGWIVYFGYKLAYPLDPGEISAAARSAETIVPVRGDSRQIASAAAAAPRPSGTSASR